MNQFSHADFRTAVAQADLAPADAELLARFTPAQQPAAWQLTPLRRAIITAGIAVNCALWAAIAHAVHGIA